ncbi:hypothetical protein D3M70_23345 [Pseudomonas sp. LS-2]|nr:hypothetical protein D3M70_23345 [Pseudomonas sp. LS-2]
MRTSKYRYIKSNCRSALARDEIFTFNMRVDRQTAIAGKRAPTIKALIPSVAARLAGGDVHEIATPGQPDRYR